MGPPRWGILMPPIRVGIVGAGRIVPAHLRGYAALRAAGFDDVRITAICSRDPEDISDDGDSWEIFTAPEDFDAVKEAIAAAGVEPVSAQISWVPSNYVTLAGSDAQKMIKLMDQLDDHDDVQNVSTNADIAAAEFE